MDDPAARRADEAWTTATSADVDLLDRAGVDEVLAALRTARSRLDAVEVRAARRLRHLAEQGRSDSAEHAISCGAGRSGRDAKGVTDRDELCEEQPELEDALDTGDLTGAHLDAIQRAAAKLPEAVRAEFLTHTDQLLARAKQLAPDAFARECRDLARFLLAQAHDTASDADELERQRRASKVTRWGDDVTGMQHTHLELDPVRDAQLQAAINRALRHQRATSTATGGPPKPWQEQLVDATLDAITGRTADHDRQAERDDEPGRNDGHVDGGGTADAATSIRVDRVPDISIVADLATLLGLADANGLCETVDGIPLPVTTVRRLCCDAEIIPTVLDGTNDIVDHGRSRRTASPQQRRALRTLYATCAHPHCTVGYSACRIHHVDHWLDHHGPTDLCNLLPLCEHHHHLVHEGNWTLTMTPDRTTTWTRPDGTRHHHAPSPNRQPRTTPTDDDPP